MHEVVSYLLAMPCALPSRSLFISLNQSWVPAAVPGASKGCISTLERARLRQNPLGIELLDKISIKHAQIKFSEALKFFKAIFFHKDTKRDLPDLAVNVELTISKFFFLPEALWHFICEKIFN